MQKRLLQHGAIYTKVNHKANIKDAELKRWCGKKNQEMEVKNDDGISQYKYKSAQFKEMKTSHEEVSERFSPKAKDQLDKLLEMKNAKKVSKNDGIEEKFYQQSKLSDKTAKKQAVLQNPQLKFHHCKRKR